MLLPDQQGLSILHIVYQFSPITPAMTPKGGKFLGLFLFSFFGQTILGKNIAYLFS
jgi:hypothetical protein